MVRIHGYELDDEKWGTKGGGGECNIATKDGKKYFIKRLGPRYPISSNFTAQEKADKIKKCDKWFATRKKILQAIPGTGTGNIVKPIEYFREGSFYYEVAHYIDIANIPYDEIWEESKENKILVMLTVASSLNEIHNAGVVHGDLDTGNILISRSDSGKLITKVIDFSDSFFADDPPKSITAKEFWMSPEVVLYVKNYEKSPNPYKKYISCKADVFSLGIIFHQYCSRNGEPPKCLMNYPWQEFGGGRKPQVDSRIDPDFRELIEKMLEYEPDNRPSMAEVKEYLQKVKNGEHPSYVHPHPKPVPVPPQPVPVPVHSEIKVSSAGMAKGISRIEPLQTNPKKVVITYANGKEQKMDLWLAKANGLIEK